MKKYGYIWLVAVSVCVLSGCSPRALDEAQRTVAQADSLRAEGRMYTDSLRMAQAYETLYAWRACHADTYAHACYHYGRLLRAEDKPVAAMQCFIAATHCRTRDYHILGRVYSNMGSIAHLAGEYSLSYDMFERSAEMFLREKDSLAYYYGLNNMAFELAEQGKKEETIDLLHKIQAECPYHEVLPVIMETKALLCIRTKQYEELIMLTQNSIEPTHYSPTILIAKAQAYYYMQEYDSAMYYSQQSIEKSKSPFDKDNAYYILIHCDSILCGGSNVYALSADRADAEKDIEIRHGKVSKASQLLQQDLNRKPNLAWLYAIIATLTIIGTGIVVYVFHKRKKHQLLAQQINDLEAKNNTNIAQRRQQIEERCSMLANSPNIKGDLCWNEFDQMCNVVNQQFGLLARKLQQTYHLSEREIRLCVLSLFNLGYDQMAEMLFYSPNGVGKFKMRVAKKLGTTAKNLQQFLIEIAIDR